MDEPIVNLFDLQRGAAEKTSAVIPLHLVKGGGFMPPSLRYVRDQLQRTLTIDTAPSSDYGWLSATSL